MKGHYQKYKDTYKRSRENTIRHAIFLNLDDNDDLRIISWLQKIKAEVGGGRGNRRGISNYLRELVLEDIEKSLTKQKK